MSPHLAPSHTEDELHGVGWCHVEVWSNASNGWRGLGVKLYVLEGRNTITRSGVSFIGITYSDRPGHNRKKQTRIVKSRCIVVQSNPTITLSSGPIGRPWFSPCERAGACGSIALGCGAAASYRWALCRLSRRVPELGGTNVSVLKDGFCVSTFEEVRGQERHDEFVITDFDIVAV
jgi:hypothetical protein